MLKLSDNYLEKSADFAAQGIIVPKYDQTETTSQTEKTQFGYILAGKLISLFSCENCPRFIKSRQYVQWGYCCGNL